MTTIPSPPEPARARPGRHHRGRGRRAGPGLEADEFGDQAVDFYGTSYIVDPMGNYVGDRASSNSEDLHIRDLDMDLVHSARYDWQFYQDRRPDASGLITAP